MNYMNDGINLKRIHITFSDIFFILFCVATLIWIAFSVRKWCKRNYGDLSLSKIRDSIRNMELSALTVDEDDHESDDEKINSADL